MTKKTKISKLYLCFINFIGNNSEESFIYDFYFSNSTDEFWGDDFEQKPAGICRLLSPYESTYTEVKRTVLNFKLDLAQEQTCFSMQDVIDGCCALGWENIDSKDYPEDGRVVFHFGMEMKNVYSQLEKRSCAFINAED